jgi:hypothetical protein
MVAEIKELRDRLGDDFSITSNPGIYVSNVFGALFKVYLRNMDFSENPEIRVTFYDTQGSSTTVWEAAFNKEGCNQDLIKAKNVLDDFSMGIVRCSDCGSKQKFSLIERNRYFAGIYCDDCWNRKWKAIEAKEDYN